MAAIELHFLGDFRVFRDGAPAALPPSKKTRALLAYLALKPRQFRREHLCELLWEIPDDPRGSLRWSLSKLRRLVDDTDSKRIVADRSCVELNTDDVAIDVLSLRQLIDQNQADSDDALEAAAQNYRGNFLEGIEFSRFHDFHSWCIAERERALRDRLALLAELVRRFAQTPDRALPHARARVGLAPYDEEARSSLIRLCHAAGQAGEAEQQFQLGMHMLREAGIPSSGALAAARQATAPASAPTVATAAETPPRGSSAPSVSPPAQSPPVQPAKGLVGRERECAQLSGTLHNLAQAQSATVHLLVGAPGVGKSRLLAALLAECGTLDATVLRAAAFESDATRPFGLWTDAIRALDASAYDAVFGASDEANRDRLFSGLANFIRIASQDRPVVIMFDDTHWSDDSSAAALHYVVRLNRDRPVLAVLAAREGELRDNTALQQSLRGLRRDGLLHELPIGPLPETALQQIITEQAPGADGERLASACAGNPLLAIELARAEIEGSGAGSLDDLVRERLARFSTAGADVLRWASALVPPFDIKALEMVTGFETPVIDEALEMAEAHAMLVPANQGLRFSHDLIAKAVYRDISPRRRQVMHRRIAEAIVREATRDLSRASWLAYHATQSNDPELAARSMVAAGRLSLRFFANEDAASLAKKGLQFVEELTEAIRVPLEIQLHEVLLTATPLDEPETVAERFASLAERALDIGDLSHARLGYHLAATIRWTQGNWEVARKQSLQSARVVRGKDSKAQVIGTAETAKCLVMLERDLSEADAMLMEASALAQRQQMSHPAICAGIGMLRFYQNRMDEAEELLQESRALCKSAGDRINEFLASEYLVVIALQRGDVDEARERAEQLVTLGNKIREGSEKPFADALVGLCHYLQHNDDEALNTALVDLRAADAKYRLAYTLTRAALADCERGEKARAVERASEALEYAIILERPTEMLLAHAVLACGHRDTEEAAQAHRTAVEELRPVAARWTGNIIGRLDEMMRKNL
ncbi:MAG: AAA family ATPase [Pseudomonadota bacterium]